MITYLGIQSIHVNEKFVSNNSYLPLIANSEGKIHFNMFFTRKVRMLVVYFCSLCIPSTYRFFFREGTVCWFRISDLLGNMVGGL